jgi:acetyl-CoA carboxylase carboxyltransferase component
MMDIINRLVDNSEFEAYKDGYGQTIITGYARIDGWAVGIVANQRKVVKPRKAKCNLEVLSTLIVLTSDASLVQQNSFSLCSSLPVLWWDLNQNKGIIKDGAKMVNAVSNSGS